MANANDTDTLGLVSALQTFDDGETAAKTLAHAVEARLREGIARRGRASLVASGGSTPKRLYEHLSHAELDWSKVAIVLADERWVDPGLTGSNETFLKTHLVQNNAKAASFIGLKTAAANPQAGLEEIEARLGEAPFPFDAVIWAWGRTDTPCPGSLTQRASTRHWCATARAQPPSPPRSQTSPVRLFSARP